MESEHIQAAVIGAGASGMTAAIHAARAGARVTLFERNESAGRKLLVTGSGHCNLSNAAVEAGRYACADPAWMDALLGAFGLADLLYFLESIGVPARATEDGWYYPLSRSAASVVAAFASALDSCGVETRFSARVSGLRQARRGLGVRFAGADGTEDEEIFDAVIVSAGGAAYPVLGSTGDLYPVLAQIGHTLLPARPALAPVLANLGSLKPLQGLRFDVEAALLEGTRRLASARGNLIFTEWGLNGPAVMDLSHVVSAHPQGGLTLSLDLLATFRADYERLLSAQRASSIPLGVFLGAFFSPKAVRTLLRNLRLAEEAPLQTLNTAQLQALTAYLSDLRLPVKGVRGFEYCQVSAGGVPVSETHPLTLESLLVPGLYLTGETLDAVGPCGGYNLHFAFASGALAGRAAAHPA